MFFPLKDENPTRRTPIATFILIVINCLVYACTIPMSRKAFQIFLFKFGLIPYELVHMEELWPEIAVPAPLTILTSMFLHSGFWHLAGNMLFLWIFGNNIEDYLGRFKFILFYFTSGLAAAGLFVLFGPNSQIPLVGASGAIAGVLGAYLVLFPRARIVTLMFLFIFIQIIRVPASFVLGFWFIYQLFMAMTSGLTGGGVAWLAHVGGFGFGWLLFRYVITRKRRTYGIWLE
nr:rhomboid family intramembrane serine protease [candidate division Zixibacteria bacterium]